MSIPAMTWALKQTAGSTGRKATLLLLGDVASEHGVLWHGVDYLAEVLECNRTTIMEHLRRLEERGLIARIERRKANGARWGTLTVLAPTGERGDMRPAGEHPAYGTAIEEALSRDFQRGDSPDPKSGFTPTLSRDSRPEPVKEPTVNRESAKAASHVKPDDPDAVRLCRILAESIRSRDPKAKLPQTGTPARDKWVTEMRLLIHKDRDGDVDEVERVLHWVLADSFEAKVVLSPGKFRDRFTDLYLKADTGRGQRLPGQPERLSGLSARSRARVERNARRRAQLEDQPQPEPQLGGPDALALPAAI